MAELRVTKELTSIFVCVTMQADAVLRRASLNPTNDPIILF